MAEFRNKLDAPVLIGVGAGFDFLSGEKPLANKFIKNSGFEWLFRLLKDPKYLWKRYFKIVPLFIILVICEYLGFYKKINK
jgi:N-acetylglucosaminyldiphosphoundecaprenol N-acetyl-beta-D-mannosaminyltransferase